MLLRKLCVLMYLLVVVHIVTSSTLLQRLSRAHFEFSLQLYHKLIAEAGPKENVMFSPSSISTVLSMLFLGAGPGSETSLQLRKVLNYGNLSYTDVHHTFKTVMETFEEPYYSEMLHAANGVFKQTGLQLSPYYERAVKEFYKSQVEELDFQNNEEEARTFMNIWISNHTDDEISGLFSLPLPPDAKLVLINAMTMKAAWLYAFNEAHTFDKGLFYVTNKKRFEIPMMIGKFKLPLGYSPSLECRVLELPFQRRRVALFILLPDDVHRGITLLEGNLTTETIKLLFSTLKDEVVNIRLPRFRVQYRSDMVSALRQMGLVDIFSPQLADFSGLSEQQLHVSGIEHKMVLEVREQGVKASAVTTSGLERLGTFGEKYFEVDHAFLYFIWDYHSGSVLFMGRVANPTPITTT